MLSDAVRKGLKDTTNQRVDEQEPKLSDGVRQGVHSVPSPTASPSNKKFRKSGKGTIGYLVYIIRGELTS